MDNTIHDMASIDKASQKEALKALHALIWIQPQYWNWSKATLKVFSGTLILSTAYSMLMNSSQLRWSRHPVWLVLLISTEPRTLVTPVVIHVANTALLCALRNGLKQHVKCVTPTKVTCNLSAGLHGSPIPWFKNIIDACHAKGYIMGVGPSKFWYHSSMQVYELLYFTQLIPGKQQLERHTQAMT